jgi:hypothetical protein
MEEVVHGNGCKYDHGYFKKAREIIKKTGAAGVLMKKCHQDELRGLTADLNKGKISEAAYTARVQQLQRREEEYAQTRQALELASLQRSYEAWDTVKAWAAKSVGVAGGIAVGGAALAGGVSAAGAATGVAASGGTAIGAVLAAPLELMKVGFGGFVAASAALLASAQPPRPTKAKTPCSAEEVQQETPCKAK